jgi:hypothetical protein
VLYDIAAVLLPCLLQWCYGRAAEMLLQWCYSVVGEFTNIATVLLQWCYSGVTVVLRSGCHR